MVVINHFQKSHLFEFVGDVSYHYCRSLLIAIQDLVEVHIVVLGVHR